MNGSTDNSVQQPLEQVNVAPALFPVKLHQILDDAEKYGFEGIVSWMTFLETPLSPRPQEQNANKSKDLFRVHKPREFANLIMPRYFPQSSKFRSFQRQLNIWCFERTETGPQKNAYHHPMFVKGCQSLCERMVRIKVKKQPFHPRLLLQESAGQAVTRFGKGQSQESPNPAGQAPNSCSNAIISRVSRTIPLQEDASFFGMVPRPCSVAPASAVENGTINVSRQESSLSAVSIFLRNNSSTWKNRAQSTNGEDMKLALRAALLAYSSSSPEEGHSVLQQQHQPSCCSPALVSSSSSCNTAEDDDHLSRTTTSTDEEELNELIGDDADFFEGRRFFHPPLQNEKNASKIVKTTRFQQLH